MLVVLSYVKHGEVDRLHVQPSVLQVQLLRKQLDYVVQLFPGIVVVMTYLL